MVSYSCVIFKKKKLNHQQLLLHSVIGTFKGKNRGKEEKKALLHQDNVLCYKSMKTMADGKCGDFPTPSGYYYVKKYKKTTSDIFRFSN